jgi:hypothetical protein
MIMKKTMGLAILLLMAVSCATSRQVSVEQQHVESALASKAFTIDVIRAYPITGPTVSLSAPYSLTVKGDSVVSHLPYYGRAFSVPYGGGAGLHFTGKLSDYRTYPGKKNMSLATFTVQSPDDVLNYSIQVSPDGNSTIIVQSKNLQTIQFSGRLE